MYVAIDISQEAGESLILQLRSIIYVAYNHNSPGNHHVISTKQADEKATALMMDFAQCDGPFTLTYIQCVIMRTYVILCTWLRFCQ